MNLFRRPIRICSGDRPGFSFCCREAASSNKLHHIFDKVGRGLEPLLNRVGGQEQLVRRVLDELVGVVPESGLFEEVVEVAGTRLVVRGTVIDGIIRVGTIFLAP